MKGDFTRSTFDRFKHYSSVRMQQGRVQVDADWNEELDILGHRTRVQTIDVIGRCGGAQANAGFSIITDPLTLSPAERTRLTRLDILPITARDFLIGPGRYYVKGNLCENEDFTAFLKQPDIGTATPVSNSGLYLAYLDVWQHHITALEDPQIRDVALGGVDTATRTKTIWQLKLLAVGGTGEDVNCVSTLRAWTDLVSPPTGKLSAQAKTEPPINDPCIISATSGFRRLENQLYRVEVHKSGTLGTATFKWSRDNGSILTQWIAQDGNKLTVGSLGKDKYLGFAPGQWIELIDETRELTSQPGTLVRIANTDGQVITIDPTSATGPLELADFPDNPRVRRWDSEGELKPTGSSGFVLLEDGVQVKFETGTYRTGDYWLIPARTATGDIEWPKDSQQVPIPAPPHGIEHSFCRIALLQFTGESWTLLSDCRELFPPLTDLTEFFHVGGEGQETRPGDPLPQALQVGVMNGLKPVGGARVRFTAQFNGRVAADPTTLPSATNVFVAATGADGVASCAWLLDGDTSRPSQQVTAELLDPAGNPSSNIPLKFTANHEQGGGSCCCVSVGGGGDFSRLEEALETLVRTRRFDMCICLMPGDHVFREDIRLEVRSGRERIHVKIVGCGEGTRLRILGGQWRFIGLASFVLRDVTIAIRTEAPVPFQFQRCGEVAIESCRIAAVSSERGAILTIGGARHLSLVGNHFSALRMTSLEVPRVVFDSLRELNVDPSGLFETLDDDEFEERAIRVTEQIVALDAARRRRLRTSISRVVKENDARLTPNEIESYARFMVAAAAASPSAEAILARIKRVRDVALRTSPGVAVIAADAGADTLIRDNEFIGVVSFYGEPGESELNVDELRALGGRFREGMVRFATEGTELQCHSNQLTRLRIGEAMIRRLKEILQNQEGVFELEGIYEAWFCGNNFFDSEQSHLLAEHLAISVNSFEVIPRGRPGFSVVPGLVATAFSQTATYVGNRASAPGFLANVSTSNSVPDTARQSANLFLSIADQ